LAEEKSGSWKRFTKRGVFEAQERCSILASAWGGGTNGELVNGLKKKRRLLGGGGGGERRKVRKCLLQTKKYEITFSKQKGEKGIMRNHRANGGKTVIRPRRQKKFEKRKASCLEKIGHKVHREGKKPCSRGGPGCERTVRGKRHREVSSAIQKRVPLGKKKTEPT